MWTLSRKPLESIDLIIPPSAVSQRVRVVNVGKKKAFTGIECGSGVQIIRGVLMETKPPKAVAT